VRSRPADRVLRVLREILREARQFDAREYRIVASQSVIDLFLDEESSSLAELQEFVGVPIRCRWKRFISRNSSTWSSSEQAAFLNGMSFPPPTGSDPRPFEGWFATVRSACMGVGP
jgi:hypothetical protein